MAQIYPGGRALHLLFDYAYWLLVFVVTVHIASQNGVVQKTVGRGLHGVYTLY